MNTDDLKAKLDALREKHEKAESDLKREYAIRALLPDFVAELPHSIHLRGLYGTSASVKVEHDFYHYSSKGTRQPTLGDALALAEAFKPCAVRQVRDGCLSFQLAAHINATDEAKKARWESEEDVSPLRVKVSGFQQRTITMEWAATVGDEIIDFDFTLPLPQWFGHLQVDYKNYMGGRRVERCNFTTNRDAVFSIFRDDEELAQLAVSPIKWGRGSDETPNDFTVYWNDLRSDRPSTPADFVRTFIAAEQASRRPIPTNS